jgi:hypothetical protein
MKLSDYPPGFAAHRYRVTPEEMEQLRHLNQIQSERQERYRKKLIEEGKLPPDPESDEKKV